MVISGENSGDRLTDNVVAVERLVATKNYYLQQKPLCW